MEPLFKAAGAFGKQKDQGTCTEEENEALKAIQNEGNEMKTAIQDELIQILKMDRELFEAATSIVKGSSKWDMNKMVKSFYRKVLPRYAELTNVDLSEILSYSQHRAEKHWDEEKEKEIENELTQLLRTDRGIFDESSFTRNEQMQEEFAKSFYQKFFPQAETKTVDLQYTGILMRSRMRAEKHWNMEDLKQTMRRFNAKKESDGKQAALDDFTSTFEKTSISDVKGKGKAMDSELAQSRAPVLDLTSIQMDVDRWEEMRDLSASKPTIRDRSTSESSSSGSTGSQRTVRPDEADPEPSKAQMSISTSCQPNVEDSTRTQDLFSGKFEPRDKSIRERRDSGIVVAHVALPERGISDNLDQAHDNLLALVDGPEVAGLRAAAADRDIDRPYIPQRHVPLRLRDGASMGQTVRRLADQAARSGYERPDEVEPSFLDLVQRIIERVVHDAWHRDRPATFVDLASNLADERQHSEHFLFQSRVSRAADEAWREAGMQPNLAFFQAAVARAAERVGNLCYLLAREDRAAETGETDESFDESGLARIQIVLETERDIAETVAVADFLAEIAAEDAMREASGITASDDLEASAEAEEAANAAANAAASEEADLASFQISTNILEEELVSGDSEEFNLDDFRARVEQAAETARRITEEADLDEYRAHVQSLADRAMREALQWNESRASLNDLQSVADEAVEAVTMEASERAAGRVIQPSSLRVAEAVTMDLGGGSTAPKRDLGEEAQHSEPLHKKRKSEPNME